MNNDQIKHLEMIEGVIERMAKSSFLYKGWALSILAVVLVLLKSPYTEVLDLLGIIPLLGFWVLDAYFLKQERLFRRLYDSIRLKNATNFSMDTSEFDALENWFKIAFSKSIFWFYSPLVIILLVKYCIIK